MARESELHLKKCQTISEGLRPLLREDVEAYLDEIHREWEADVKFLRITRVLKLKNYQEGLDLVASIGALAQQENHHPVLKLQFRELVVEIFTTKINGLHENDFILAAKIDRIYNQQMGLIG
jgi:4a-hydroxytetrahydrobiopterin dehydratase